MASLSHAREIACLLQSVKRFGLLLSVKKGRMVWLCCSHLSRSGEISRAKKKQSWLESLPREQRAVGKGLLVADSVVNWQEMRITT